MMRTRDRTRRGLYVGELDEAGRGSDAVERCQRDLAGRVSRDRCRCLAGAHAASGIGIRLLKLTDGSYPAANSLVSRSTFFN